jgi:asparagine synthase (glutamine-hydrolysing)
MCGIAGLFTREGRQTADLAAIAERMTQKLAHRGPDGAGAWVSEQANVSFGHRRLSIIDTSDLGAQPMHSHCGRYVATFNGEIYNYQSLRLALEQESAAPAWRGGSDTEVLLACVTRYGLKNFLPMLDGMFALAIWDKQERQLLLARDPLGEKPLYYGFVGDALAFASELKSLKPVPHWSGHIACEALHDYFQFGYVPAPLSIFSGIFKLLPGHFLIATAVDVASQSMPQSQAYWSLDDVIAGGRAAPFAGTSAEAVSALDARLRDVIKRQMVADVPLGAFLSGGIDSSTTVALMQAQSMRPIKTFTIGFAEAEFNEAQHAKAVADHLRTDHTELYVSTQNALRVIPKLAEIYDEPFADSSQIPTFLVSELARQHVTVSLSGDGGDELFGGYNRYDWGVRLWKPLSLVPNAVRYPLHKALQSIPPQWVGSTYSAISPLLPAQLRFSQPAEKWSKALDLFGIPNQSALYSRLVSQWPSPNKLLKTPVHSATAFALTSGIASALSFRHQMMRLDTLTYLPDDILVKVDRASMAVSLESRVPMLDKSIVQFAWQLPESLKVRDGQTKWILKQLLNQYVPKTLIDRPKMGFGVPIGRWLRHELREWGEALLDPVKIEAQGYLKADIVQNLWHEHQSGQRNWQYQLWTVLMFQAWLSSQ